MQLTDMEYWNIVKKNFGIPYTFFELSYDQVIEYSKMYSLRGISKRLPHSIYIYIDESNLINRDNQRSEFKIPYDNDIHSIVAMYGTNSDIIAGFPINPILSGVDDATQHLTEIMNAKPAIQSSSALYNTYEFIEPNILKIFGAIPTKIILKLNVNHTSFETLPARFSRDCIDYCIADLKEMLGIIRSRYTEMQTPFGTINLGADTLLNQAESMRSKIIEEFMTLPPNVIVQLN